MRARVVRCGEVSVVQIVREIENRREEGKGGCSDMMLHFYDTDDCKLLGLMREKRRQCKVADEIGIEFRKRKVPLRKCRYQI